MRHKQKPLFSSKAAGKTAQAVTGLPGFLKYHAQRHQIHALCGMLM
jgi:hypothetical protein